jgi:hypothetical protein
MFGRLTLASAALLIMSAVATYDVMSAQPARAHGHCSGRGCVETDPRDEGFGGSVETQIGVLRQGSTGASNPIRCDPSRQDARGRYIDEDGDPIPPEELDGVMRWVWDTESNESNQDRHEPREGTYYRRVCRIDGENIRYHLPDSTCYHEFDPALCGAECGLPGSEEWCTEGRSLIFFDAIDPVQLTEYAMRQEFEALIAEPEPHFAPEGTTSVNVDTYLWVTGTDTRDSFFTSIAVPGISLSIEAVRGDFIWDMGNGDVVTCPTSGITPGAEMGDGTCAYSYDRSSAQQPREVYVGNVAIEWIGIYSGTDGYGELIEEEHSVVRDNEFEIRVGEIQAVIVG